LNRNEKQRVYWVRCGTTTTRCNDGALHIMWSCNPGIWPALVRTNKYSKARNREARRGEANSSRAVPLFPPYGARFLNHIHAIPLGRAVRIKMRACMRSSLYARHNAASCELIPDARIANNRVRDAAYLVWSYLACNNEIAASERCHWARAFSRSPRESREK